MKTVYLLTPLTDAAKAWVNENVHVESWNKLGNSIGVETRFVGPIVEGMLDAGFELEADFSVV